MTKEIGTPVDPNFAQRLTKKKKSDCEVAKRDDAVSTKP